MDCGNASAGQQEMRGMECSGRGEEWEARGGEVREGTCRRGKTGTSIGLGRRVL